MDDVPQKPWQFEKLEKFGIKIEEKDFPDIKTIIQNASDSKELKDARAAAKDEAWFYRGHSAEHVVDFLKSKITTTTTDKE